MNRIFLISVMILGVSFGVAQECFAETDSNLSPNIEHVEYWMRTLETSPLIIIRKQAARQLGTLQNNIAVPSLIRSLSDANEDVRIQCAYSLGRLGDSSSLKSLYELIEKSPSAQLKSAARSAIEKINAHEEFAHQKKQKFDDHNEKKSAN